MYFNDIHITHTMDRWGLLQNRCWQTEPGSITGVGSRGWCWESFQWELPVSWAGRMMRTGLPNGSRDSLCLAKRSRRRTQSAWWRATRDPTHLPEARQYFQAECELLISAARRKKSDAKKKIEFIAKIWEVFPKMEIMKLRTQFPGVKPRPHAVWLENPILP